MVDLEDSNSILEFPVLPHEQPDRPLSSFQSINMASISDDADSMSSFNESAWDMVDERSAASEDEGASQVSRFPTPMSEIPEPIYMEPGSMAGNDTDSEAPSQEHEARFRQSRKDSSSDPPDTARPFTTAPKRQSALLEDQTTYVKFQECEDDSQEVSFVLTEFHDAARLEQLSFANYNPRSQGGLAGTVIQTMAKKGLSPSGPFKVIYVGAAEMKETVVNKLASALATSPSFSPKHTMKSSRVTVVPISSFADDSSPDVVLIDSMGIDMNIEEVKSAEKKGSSIMLAMTNRSRLVSRLDVLTNKFTVSDGYEMPDLAVVYVPQRESSAAKMTRSYARQFFDQHQIPVLLISYDTKWKTSTMLADVDQRLPHLAVEAFWTETGQSIVIRRQAIDINTFVSIDSAQLSRSLASLVPQHSFDVVEDTSSKLIADAPFWPTLKEVRKGSRKSSGFWSVMRFLAVLIALIGAVGLQRTIVEQLRWPSIQPIVNHHDVQSQVSSTSTTFTATISTVVTSTITETLATSSASSTSSIVTSSIANRIKEATHTNKSNKFQIEVVGDNHVLLFTPATFVNIKAQTQLHIKTHRKGETIPHEFSFLHNGVYALKFPPESAHGTITISLWTTSPGKSFGEFHAEFGSPWLKISGWQQAALVMKDHLAEDISSLRAGLQSAFTQSNGRVKHFFQDAVGLADNMITEVEKISLGSSLQANNSVVEQTKHFTALFVESIQGAAAACNPAKFSDYHQNLLKDMSTYSSQINSMFRSQAKSLALAASSIGKIGQEIQSYRETHFVNEQRRLLQLYWNVFGMPERLQEQLRQKRQEMVDEDIWGSGKRSSWRKKMQKAREEAIAKSWKAEARNTMRAKRAAARSRS